MAIRFGFGIGIAGAALSPAGDRVGSWDGQEDGGGDGGVKVETVTESGQNNTDTHGQNG